MLSETGTITTETSRAEKEKIRKQKYSDSFTSNDTTTSKDAAKASSTASRSAEQNASSCPSVAMTAVATETSQPSTPLTLSSSISQNPSEFIKTQLQLDKQSGSCYDASTPLPNQPPTLEEMSGRSNANTNNEMSQSGTPDWESAREHRFTSIASSEKVTINDNSSQGIVPPKSNSQGGESDVKDKGSLKKGRRSPDNLTKIVNGESPEEGRRSSGRGRGQGRGRGRGRGRGDGAGDGSATKRKRMESHGGSENDSDISTSYTPLQTRTKSGRNVVKPVQYTPYFIPPNLSAGAKRKRSYERHVELMNACRLCERSVSGVGNSLVFCGSCKLGWHQYCHDPPIEPGNVDRAVRRWVCRSCKSAKEGNGRRVPGLVGGRDWKAAEKVAYLSTLPKTSLVDLLIHASSMHPSLPLFPAKNQSQEPRRQSQAPSLTSPSPNNGNDDSQHHSVKAHINDTKTPVTHSTSSPNLTELKMNLTPSMPPPPSQNPQPSQKSQPSDHLLRVQMLDQSQKQPREDPSLYNQRLPDRPSNQTPDRMLQYSRPNMPTSTPFINLTNDSTEVANKDHDTNTAAAASTATAATASTTDLSAHYPRPGNGLARTLGPEEEDLEWLVEEEGCVGFRHVVYSVDGVAVER